MVENGEKHGQNSHSIIHCPTSEGVSEVSERTDERVAQYFSLYFWLIWPTVEDKDGKGEKEGRGERKREDYRWIIHRIDGEEVGRPTAAQSSGFKNKSAWATITEFEREREKRLKICEQKYQTVKKDKRSSIGVSDRMGGR